MRILCWQHAPRGAIDLLGNCKLLLMDVESFEKVHLIWPFENCDKMGLSDKS